MSSTYHTNMAASRETTGPSVSVNPNNKSSQLMETDSRCTPPLTTKPLTMNHRKWRAYLKKMKRKEKRATLAKERDSLFLQDEGVAEEPATDSDEERKRQEEEAESRRQNERWLERERQAQLAFQAKKEWEEKERKKKEEIERKIKEEWDERVRREKEEQDEKDKRDTEKRSKQDKLLKEATANENTGAWHNPIAPVQYGEERKIDLCPFFKKTGACRFGDQCSRFHEYPETSRTILLPGMFASFELEQSVVDNQDTDIGLEYDDEELYQSFEEFYEDVVPEFKKLGTIVQFKVCRNYEPHLRGNVYVQYKHESAAQAAYQKFVARWFGGKQLNCFFVNIDSWKSAICGLAFRKRCPKGKLCNFLHVFRDPHGEFTDMDRDQPAVRSDRRSGGMSCRADDYRRRHNHRRDSISPSRSSHNRQRHRSRSPHSYSRSSHNRQRHRSRSPHSPSRSSHYRQRHRSRSPHSTSRSPDTARKSSSRHRSKSKRRSRSRDRDGHGMSRSDHSRAYSRSSDRNGHGKTGQRHSRARSRSRSNSPYCHKTRPRSRSRERHSRSKSYRSPHNKTRSPCNSSRSYSRKSSLSSYRSQSRSPSPSDQQGKSRSRSSSPGSEHNETSVSGTGFEMNQDIRTRSRSRSSSDSPERNGSSKRSHRKSSNSNPKKRKETKEEKISTSKNSGHIIKSKISDGWESSSEEEYEYTEVTKETMVT